MKRIVALLLALTMVLSLAACGSKTDAGTTTAPNAAGSETTKGEETPAGNVEDVKLIMWGAEEDQTMLREMADAFIEANKDLVNLTIEIGVCSESTAKDTVLTDVEAAADVFAFADDQLNDLVNAGALQAIPAEMGVEDIKAANVSGSVEAATMNGQLYAYPMTASNGYFMFYNKEYFTEDDVKTLDRMLEVAAAADKKVVMELNSGWYLYSFFKGAGLEMGLNEDGQSNHCNWNATDTAIKGVDVVQAILDITAQSSFGNYNSDQFAAGVKDGTVIAGVNGTWNATVASEAWGENYAACALPTYTVNGEQVQMASFSGYKLLGVNPHSKNVGWAMKLAEWVTNEENQTKRFEMRGEGPSNINAAASEAVQAAPAIVALVAQSNYATLQRVAGPYWTPAQTLGDILAAGNPDGIDLQTLLDTAVEGIIAPPAQ